MKRTGLILLAGLAAISAPAAAFAQTPPPGYHEHDGLFLRFHAGPGFTRLSAKEGSSEVAISGGGIGFGFALGGRVASNLLLFGELVSDLSMEPDVEVNGAELGTAKNVTAGVSGIGVGVAYYLPINLYFSGTLTSSVMTIEDSDPTDDDKRRKLWETKRGVGLALSFGKEWWVSANWALGIAGRINLAQAKGKDPVPPATSAPTFRAVGAAVLFSASFN